MEKSKVNNIRLCDDIDCTGCFACAGVCPKDAIYTIQDVEGFDHPRIDVDKCIQCHLCEKSCPVLNPIVKNESGKVYAAWSKDETIRSTSSSGGMFSVFANAIIDEGGVVVGASMGKDDVVRHIIVEKKEDLPLLRGSKYVQSDLNREVYLKMGKYLRDGRKVLFTGTPCQVAGVSKVFKRFKDNLYTVDVVCHGVPSPAFWGNFIHNLREKYHNIVSYQFRDFKNWLVCTNVNVNVNVNVNEKPIIENKYLYGEDTYYLDAFLKGLLHRPNCYHCQYTDIHRASDITLSDFWGIGKYKPISPDYKEGCSMVSVNTKKGSELFNKTKDQIFFEERDIQETIDGGNEQLVHPSIKPKGRDTFYSDAKTLTPEQLIEKYHLKLIKAPGPLWRRGLGKIKRTIKQLFS